MGKIKGKHMRRKVSLSLSTDVGIAEKFLDPIQRCKFTCAVILVNDHTNVIFAEIVLLLKAI